MKLTIVKKEIGLYDILLNETIIGHMTKLGSYNLARLHDGTEIKASNQQSVKRLLSKKFNLK